MKKSAAVSVRDVVWRLRGKHRNFIPSLRINRLSSLLVSPQRRSSTCVRRGQLGVAMNLDEAGISTYPLTCSPNLAPSSMTIPRFGKQKLDLPAPERRQNQAEPEMYLKPVE